MPNLDRIGATEHAGSTQLIRRPWCCVAYPTGLHSQLIVPSRLVFDSTFVNIFRLELALRVGMSDGAAPR